LLLFIAVHPVISKEKEAVTKGAGFLEAPVNRTGAPEGFEPWPEGLTM
jgi:hypothetical protein